MKNCLHQIVLTCESLSLLSTDARVASPLWVATLLGTWSWTKSESLAEHEQEGAGQQHSFMVSALTSLSNRLSPGNVSQRNPLQVAFRPGIYHNNRKKNLDHGFSPQCVCYLTVFLNFFLSLVLLLVFLSLCKFIM